jgi:hypothetical protein
MDDSRNKDRKEHSKKTAILLRFALILSQIYIPSGCGAGFFFMIRVRIRGSVKVSQQKFNVRYRLFVSVRIRGSVMMKRKNLDLYSTQKKHKKLALFFVVKNLGKKRLRRSGHVRAAGAFQPRPRRPPPRPLPPLNPLFHGGGNWFPPRPLASRVPW